MSADIYLGAKTRAAQNQVKQKEAGFIPLSPYPSPTEVPSSTPSSAIQTYQAQTTFIDCVGPDGKHLQVTQQECDNFNNAWHNSPTVTPNVYQNALQQYGQDTLNATCHQEVETTCIPPAYEAVTVCVNTCTAQANLDDNSCTDSSTQDSCLSAVNAKMSSCDTSCQNTYQAALDKCNSLCN